MKTISFVTGNSYKFEVAQKCLKGTDIDIVQEKLETPEIQSTEVEEIASYSAKWAANKLGKSVVISDAGWYIEALNGFPGPFVKYINHWLSTDDLLRIMSGKENRKVMVKDCLAYCEPGKEPVIFVSESFGTLTTYPIKKVGASSIDALFLPEGFAEGTKEISWEDMLAFWAKSSNNWRKIVTHLSK